MTVRFIALLLLSASSPVCAQSAWNGDWRLNAARSSAEARDGAADGYRFTITGNHIRWEIPSLKEVGVGELDGRPFPLRRGKTGSAGMTLSVHAEGPGVLVYSVARNGKTLGDGRMTLVDGNRAWVDLTHNHGAPYWGAQIVYVRR